MTYLLHPQQGMRLFMFCKVLSVHIRIISTSLGNVLIFIRTLNFK